jgi:pilus assembly protein Flp/PilA
MRTKIKNAALRLWKDESGASLIEYSMLIGLITAALVGAIGIVVTAIEGKWAALCTAIGTSCPAN